MIALGISEHLRQVCIMKRGGEDPKGATEDKLFCPR